MIDLLVYLSWQSIYLLTSCITVVFFIVMNNVFVIRELRKSGKFVFLAPDQDPSDVLVK